MLEILTGTFITFKTFIVSSTLGLFGGIKVYGGALYLLTKPFIIYGTMRFTWLLGLATVEWWSARLYSINCIGEGIEGFYNHLFQIASPACTGLLTTHIGLMGVLVASFVITCIWSIYSFVEYIKKSTPGNSMMNEYNNVHNMIYKDGENDRTRSNYRNRNKGRSRSRSRSPSRNKYDPYSQYY